MEAKLINDKKQWDSALQNFPQKDIYFEYDYHTLYINNKNESAEAFYFSDNKNKFFLPYIKKEIPAYDGWYDFETVYGYTGPIVTSNDTDFLDNAWQKFRHIMERSGIVCGLIRFHPLLDNAYLKMPEYIKNVGIRETVYVDLDRSYEDVWKSFGRGTKGGINKANRIKLTKKILFDEKNYISFYHYYIEHMKYLDAVDFYFFKKSYFLDLRRLGVAKSKIYFAYLEDKVIAGTIILYGNVSCHYHLSWFLQDRRIFRPTEFLLSEVVKDAIDSGYKKFHLGGGITNKPDDSLLMFKKSFSKKTKPFNVGKVTIDSEKYKTLCSEWDNTSSSEIKNMYGNYFLKYRH